MSVNRCPYLGTKTDAETCFAFPDAGNFCHRHGSAQPIELTHQAGFCLSQGYPRCEVFRQVQGRESALQDTKPVLNRPAPRLVPVILLLLVLVAGVMSSFIYLTGAATNPERLVGPGTTPTSIGGFVIFVNGTPRAAGVDLLTPEPVEESLWSRLMGILATSTPTPFQPLPTSTPMTPSPTPTDTATPSPTIFIPATLTNQPAPFSSRTPLGTRTATSTVTLTLPPGTVYPSATITPLPSRTPSPSATATTRPNQTPTQPPAPTEIPPTPFPTATPTRTASPTAAPTSTNTPGFNEFPTSTATP